PRGPATTANPMPATRARVKKSSSIGALRPGSAMVAIGAGVMMGVVVAGIGDAAIGMAYAPVRQMGVVVAVAVDGKGLGGAAAEQVHIFGAGGDGFRRAG